PIELLFSTSQYSYSGHLTEEPVQLFQKEQHEDQEFMQLSNKQQKSNCINEDIEYKTEDSAEFPNWNTLERTLKKYKLEVGFKKNIGAIFINKLIDEYNHSLALYQKEFALNLYSLLQEVLDEIKFLTQECGLEMSSNQRENDAMDIIKWLMQQKEQEPEWAVFIDIFKISHNAKFDIKLISKHWYTDPIQAFDYSVILDTSTIEFNTNEERNQVISIREPDTYRASIHNNITQKQEYVHGFGIAKNGLKFALESGLVNKFVELITGFIKNHTGIDTNKRITVKVTQIENPKKLKNKEHLKLPKPAQQSDQDLNTKCKQITETDTKDEYAESSLRKRANNETNNGNSTQRHCGNCYRTRHYASTCQFFKNNFR
ncbi:18267_t:CDS:2, partial [Gigaspora margarita]